MGLVYMRGMLGLHGHDVKYLFSSTIGHPVFGATMSKNRFKILHACLTFDDQETRQARWKQDRFAAFREFFETFNNNCSMHIIPEAYLALDETLYPARTHISFKQYNTNKPAKYGLLFKSINASTYSYTFTSFPYCGKPLDEPTCYYVSETEETVKYLVDKLQNHTDLQGRNLSFDRLYTSIPLAQFLLNNCNMTCVGTLQTNRRGIPKEIKDMEDREDFSYNCYWEANEKKLVLHSYVVKTKSTGKRNVLMLSSMPPLLGTMKDSKRKPAIYKFYKGGTDVVDQRIQFYSCKTKSRRWTTIAFSYVLDTCRVNAGTIMAMNKGEDPKKQNSFMFGWDLGMSLVLPHVQRRSWNNLPRSITDKIEVILKNSDLQNFQALATRSSEQRPSHSSTSNDSPMRKQFDTKSQKRRRCHFCPPCRTSEPCQKRSRKDFPKSKNQCQICGKAVCPIHALQACKDCMPTFENSDC